MLDPSIRKSHRVRALPLASSIIRLSSIKVGAGVVISNSILIGEGRELISIGRLSMISWGCMDYRSMICRGSMDHWSSMIGRGSMDHWGSMIGRSSMIGRGSMSYNSMRGSMITSHNCSLSQMCGKSSLCTATDRVMG